MVRRYRTPAQIKADALEEIKKVEARERAEAADLLSKSDKWKTTAKELSLKAEGAEAKALLIIKSLGFDGREDFEAFTATESEQS